MLMTDWRMIRKKPALIQRFRHHSHQAKRFDAALCIVSFTRRKMMCSTGLQSFVMWALVGDNIRLHQILSRRVCHRRTLMHLEMEPMGFDFFSILRTFYIIHPDRFLTDESDIGRIAWALYFGRMLNCVSMPINHEHARVFAEYGYLIRDELSSLVLAMIDPQKSFQIFSELHDRSDYWHIAWANAVVKEGFKVPTNIEIFKRLRVIYRKFKLLANNVTVTDGLLEETLWTVGAFYMDAICTLSMITGKKVYRHIKKNFNPCMAPKLLNRFSTHYFPVKSGEFLKASGVAVPFISIGHGSATNSSNLTICSIGNKTLELSTEVQGQKVILAYSLTEDFHALCSSVSFIQMISEVCFATQICNEIKFWGIKCSRHKIILLATLDLSRFFGPHVAINFFQLFKRQIILWIDASQLVVIPFSISENGFFLGKPSTFPLTYFAGVNQVDKSETKFKVYYTVLEGSCIRTRRRILNCAGE
jgi:hypothetical protein